MNRKEFIYSTLGVISAFQLSTWLKNNPKIKHHVIGLGTTGAHIINEIAKEFPKASFTIIDHEIQSDLNPQIDIIDYYEFISNIQYQTYHHWLNRLKKDQTYLVIGCLGGLTGSILCKKLIPYLHNKQLNYEAIVTFPFHWEGKRRNGLARMVSDELENYPHIRYIHLDELLANHRDLKLTKAFEFVRAEIKNKSINLLNA
jgi:hypothetical protein